MFFILFRLNSSISITETPINMKFCIIIILLYPFIPMWVCATGAQHSNSLERRSQRTACLRGEANIYTDVYISCESGEWWLSNVDMWVGTRSAWHSKSLEWRCQIAVRMFPGCYYTRCALKALSHDIRTIFSTLRARRFYHAPLIEKS